MQENRRDNRSAGACPPRTLDLHKNRHPIRSARACPSRSPREKRIHEQDLQDLQDFQDYIREAQEMSKRRGTHEQDLHDLQDFQDKDRRRAGKYMSRIFTIYTIYRII